MTQENRLIDIKLLQSIDEIPRHLPISKKIKLGLYTKNILSVLPLNMIDE